TGRPDSGPRRARRDRDRSVPRDQQGGHWRRGRTGAGRRPAGTERTKMTPTTPRSRSASWRRSLIIAALLLPPIALAALPEPTPEQQRAAAEKKAQAGQQAERDKQALLEKMNQLAERWRTRAGESGWKTHT